MYSGRVFFRKSYNLALFFSTILLPSFTPRFWWKMHQNCIHFGVQKRNLFLTFLSLCSGASRGARGPHPANPKAPQRRFMGAIVGALGCQSDAPNARKMTQRRPLNLISGKDELRWSFKTHSESFFLFCKLFRGQRWPLESILAQYGAKHVLGLPLAPFFAIFVNTFTRRHFKCTFHVVLHSFDANLCMNVNSFPTPCVTSSLFYFWYLADDLFMLFLFGRPYGTGGISAWEVRRG